MLISSCKEDCPEVENPFIELKLVSADDENITNHYRIDSIRITNLDCNEIGFSAAYGKPKETTDSSFIYSLGYCQKMDSIRYVIRMTLNSHPIDTFMIYLEDIAPDCSGSSIVDAKNLSTANYLWYSEEKIEVLIKVQ